MDSRPPESRKPDLRSIRNVYSNRPNMYTERGNMQQYQVTEDAGIFPVSAPSQATSYLQDNNARARQTHIAEGTSLMATSFEAIDGTSPADVFQHDYENILHNEASNRRSTFDDVNRDLHSGAGEDSAGNNGQRFYQRDLDQQRAPSDEYLNELSKQLTQRDEGANAAAISSVRPSPRSYSRDLNAANEQQGRGYERVDIDASGQQQKSRGPDHATVKTETTGVHSGGPKAKSSMQVDSPAPKTSNERPIVHRERPKNQTPADHNDVHKRRNSDLENGPPSPMKPENNNSDEDSLQIQERSRFYESQLELYVGFMGIQIIFIYANFVFSNYAGGVLSLFTMIAACYSHLDRRPSSYLLTTIIVSIQILVLCIAVSVGIHGFYPYRDDPTLKAISIGAIPIGLVFIFLNVALAYQHSYSLEAEL